MNHEKHMRYSKDRISQFKKLLSTKNESAGDSTHVMNAVNKARVKGDHDSDDRPKKWMAEAFSKNEGALTRKAKSAGEGTMAFAREKYHASGKTGQQARAAVNAQKWRG